MNCPNCHKWSREGDAVCQHCGTPLNPEKKSQHKHKMTFNTIFAIWMMITYAPSSSGGLALLECESITEFFVVLFALAVCAFVIWTGILLIKRDKKGFVFQYIINSFGLLIWGAVFLFAVLCLLAGSTAEMAEFSIFASIFGVVFTIFSIPPIALHLSGLIYYTVNRKKYFELHDPIPQMMQ